MAVNPIKARYERLEEGQGPIEASLTALQREFNLLLQVRLRIEVVVSQGVLFGSLVNEMFDKTMRERGGQVPIVMLVGGSAREKPIWVSWTEVWREGSRRRRFIYHTTGLTVFRGDRKEQQKIQLFRAEWPGVRAVVEGEPQFEAQGAGHPHWQFDVLRSIQVNAEAELERRRVESVVADTTPVEDFEIEKMPSNQVPIDLAEFRWTRVRFASLADWPVTPWNGNPGIVRQHARGPASLVELHNWVLSTLRYIRREVQR